jgi:uncharacterized membrane-anchored protein YhcB (DUF1043 family)
MLIGLGIALIAILFGGSQSNLLFTEIDSYVKKNVDDKERKELVLSEIKAVKKLQKNYQKKTKKFTKEMGRLINNHATTKEEFDTYFATVVDFERETDAELIPKRIFVQNTLTQQEWDEIIMAAKKKINKNNKSNDKSLKSVRKALDKLEQDILKHTDETNKKEVLSILADFDEKFYNYCKDVVNYDDTGAKTLRDKNATEEDLLEVVRKNNNKWIELFDIYSNLHGDLVKIIPEDKWKSVAKQLNKL